MNRKRANASLPAYSISLQKFIFSTDFCFFNIVFTPFSSHNINYANLNSDKIAPIHNVKGFANKLQYAMLTNPFAILPLSAVQIATLSAAGGQMVSHCIEHGDSRVVMIQSAAHFIKVTILVHKVDRVALAH